MIQIVLVINNPVEDGSYLAESRDQHDARDECDAGGERGKKRENHQRIANVIIPDIDEFVRDDVVAVVGGPWCSHGVAVQIEDSSYDCEQRDELKLQNSLIDDSLSTSATIDTHDADNGHDDRSFLDVDILVVLHQRPLVPGHMNRPRRFG